MDFLKFSIGRLVLYFVLVSLFLFVSASVGQYLIEMQSLSRQLGMFLQGIIFTALTIIVLYLLKRKNPDVLARIGLKGMNSFPKLLVGIALPFILLISGILTAYLLGGIENVSLNLTTTVVLAILINSVTAFLYEAFPEEVFIRGLIFEELHKKYRFIISLILQPLIFIAVPTAVLLLQTVFFGNPFTLTIAQVLLFFFFGIALQLYREYTGTLWMNIIFHVIYLEVARYISVGGMYASDVALLVFDETFEGFMLLYLSFMFIVILSVVVLSVLVFIDKRGGKHNV
ncbi:CPBP family intramembrane glutamic endopeptidase [Bacillus ndiopicus]|uniref:CPBP family intramembrane glutamic endopeptidase n=1 Tax=Bacillus ndiopicus TaxID=1347368 RepID=UPI0005A8B7D7|nr:CPBP family intramembrane glutamic endopeptidase [Bacillus ndiopicus]